MTRALAIALLLVGCSDADSGGAPPAVEDRFTEYTRAAEKPAEQTVSVRQEEGKMGSPGPSMGIGASKRDFAPAARVVDSPEEPELPPREPAPEAPKPVATPRYAMNLEGEGEPEIEVSAVTAPAKPGIAEKAKERGPARARKKKPMAKTIVLDELLIEGKEESGEGDLLVLANEDLKQDKGVDQATRDGELRNDDGRLRQQNALDRGDDSGWLLTEKREERPDSFLPRVFYFENTYLGGNAAHEERLRRLDRAFGGRTPYRAAKLPPQAFDAPNDAGLALTAQLDRRYVDKPGRVVLQVGLQGSQRFGWRRPPIDVVLVVDQPVLANEAEVLVEAVTGLLRRLGAQDRVGVVLVGPEPVVLSPLGPVKDVRRHLAKALDGLSAPPAATAQALARAMDHAGDMLEAGSDNTARVPGAQTVLLMAAASGGRAQQAAQAAHQLNLRGLQNSVIDVSQEADNDWWEVANAGYGNYHRANPDDVMAAIDAELESLSRVIARLLRLNVRLAPDVQAIRVLGSRVLEGEEVARVKAREEAVDAQLSKTLGVKADRGADDDGIQTVIPYFYGGDSHVVLIELWVEKPGPVADVTLKFKDMVKLGNATAQTRASLSSLPRPETMAEKLVRRNVRGFDFAEALAEAAKALRRGNRSGAKNLLSEARGEVRGRDAALVADLIRLVDSGGSNHQLAEALAVASERRIGAPP